MSTTIAENLLKFKDKPAFFYLDRKFSYQEIDVYSQKLATYLQNLGLAAGSRIAVMLPNIIQYPIATFAIIRAGYILVNVNPMYTQRELYHQVQDSGAEALIILGSTLEQLNNLDECPALKHVISTHPLDFIQDQSISIYSQMEQYPEKQFSDFKQVIDQVQVIDFVALYSSRKIPLSCNILVGLQVFPKVLSSVIAISYLILPKTVRCLSAILAIVMPQKMNMCFVPCRCITFMVLPSACSVMD